MCKIVDYDISEIKIPKQIVNDIKSPEEELKKHLEKFSWLWEDNSPYPWENKKAQIKNQQEQQNHR